MVRGWAGEEDVPGAEASPPSLPTAWPGIHFLWEEGDKKLTP